MFLRKSIFALILSVLAALTFIFGGRLKTDREKEKMNYKGIITLWHIDTFEGGTGSRKKFLSDLAIRYEKKHAGTLIMVIDYTVAGAEEEMKNGKFPDMISFGNGLVLKEFSPLKTAMDYPEGNFSGKSAAAIWTKGEYALFSKKELSDKKIEDLTVSQSEYNLPLVAFALSGFTAKNVTVKQPTEAYADFVNGESDCFLGTQRDVYRLSNRGFNAVITPLFAFSDLNQFIAITGDDSEKNACAQEYIDMLLSDEVQEQLNKIGLFSVKKRVVYEDENLSALSKIKNNGISAFLGKEKIEEIRALSLSAATGNGEAIKKINNITFIP